MSLCTLLYSIESDAIYSIQCPHKQIKETTMFGLAVSRVMKCLIWSDDLQVNDVTYGDSNPRLRSEIGNAKHFVMGTL